MKRLICAVFTGAFLLLFASSGFSADVAKIGIVDFEKIVKESSAGKLIQKEMADKGGEFKETLQKEKEELDNLSKAFERESLVLSPDKKREKEREIRIRINDFKKMQEDFSKEFKRVEIQKLNQMQKDIFEIANEMGKKEGFLLIIEKKNAGVIYVPDHVDITEKVIQQYNANTAKAE